MFGLGKKVEIKEKNINEAYREYVKNPNNIMIICVDEQIDYDKLHVDGAECLPLRLIDQFDEYYPEKDMTYYIYAINIYNSKKACQKLIKKGYKVYQLSSFLDYRERGAGNEARKKDKKRRK